VTGYADQKRNAAVLGGEYPAYAAWILEQEAAKQVEFNKEIKADRFAVSMRSIDYNSDKSLYDFEQFLLRPHIHPITIGYVGQTLIKLAPEPYQLDTHSLDQESEGIVDDNRASVSCSILGLWSDSSSLRRGQYSDEGYASDDTLEKPVQRSLEGFQQLGLLYWQRLGSQEDFQPSNYVLVTSVYDDSIWVIWRKFIMDQNTAEEDLAKEVWQGDYAVFPGMTAEEGERETVIYAKLADNWDSLRPSPDTALGLTRINHAPSSRNPNPEPTLVRAVRTVQGGIRRLNDFRSMLPRPKRSWGGASGSQA